MRGQSEPEMAAAVLIFTFAAVTILGFLQANIIMTNTSVEVARGEMEVIDITHLLVKCLENDGVIHLSDMNDESLDDCGFQSVFILLTDVETGERLWDNGKPRGDHGYSLPVPIELEDGTIVGGDLYVKI